MVPNSTHDASLPFLPADAFPTDLPTSLTELVPPPPPPMPHHLQERATRARQKAERKSVMVQKFNIMPADWLTTGYTLDDNMPSEPCEFRKVYYFFYGTLEDPKTLSRILDRDIERSSLRPAVIIGYSCERWGIYKALVDGPMDAVVEGVAYEVQCEEDEIRLAVYETDAYETHSCLIDLKSEKEDSAPQTISGKTFKYAGDPDALRQGRFDRKLWVKGMAPELRYRF